MPNGNVILALSGLSMTVKLIQRPAVEQDVVDHLVGILSLVRCGTSGRYVNDGRRFCYAGLAT